MALSLDGDETGDEGGDDAVTDGSILGRSGNPNTMGGEAD